MVKLIIVICQAASSNANIAISEITIALEDTAQSSDSIAFKQSDMSIVSQEMDNGELSAAASSSQIIEQFERATEELDAQDRMDQFVLEDELSDVRITEQGSKEQSSSIGELLDNQSSTTSVQPSLISSGNSDTVVAKTGSHGSQLISVSASQRLVESCQDLLCGSCELVHMRCAKILNIRAKVCVSVCLSPNNVNISRQARCPIWLQLISC